MKKTYIQPLIEVVQMGTLNFICASNGVKSNNGIGYGGVDDGGVLDPASRRSSDEWDDE